MKLGRKIALIVSAALSGVLLFVTMVGGALLLADGMCDLDGRVLPSYEKADISALVSKEEWTEEELSLLSLQTGVSKSVLPSIPREALLGFQEYLFAERTVRHEAPAYFSSYDYLVEGGVRVNAPMIPLEKGDVLVSTASHTVGWRHGHSALVIDPSRASVLQCISIGLSSNVYLGGTDWFREAANFMVLRLKGVSEEERAAIAERAAKELKGIPYSLTVGIFSSKDQCGEGAPEGTQCSHLVWQAFYNAGFDIDSDGGGVVTTSDIFASPLFEIVQVYGFDPAEYLDR